MKIQTDEGEWTIRKPTGREIFLLQDLNPEKMNSEQSFEAMKKILEKVIVQSPIAPLDLETLPADTFLTLFFESCQSTLEVLSKQSLT